MGICHSILVHNLAIMTVYLEESFEILIQVIVERSEVGVVEMWKGVKRWRKDNSH